MANAFIASVPRKELSEIRGYFMRHSRGPDIGFSWNENDPRYPVDQWERIPAVAKLPPPDVADFQMHVMHAFLEWNRAQPKPPVEIATEYGVAHKVLELAGLAGAEPFDPPPVSLDTSDGADARLICKVAREAGTPIPVETARAILAALAAQAASAAGPATLLKED